MKKIIKTEKIIRAKCQWALDMNKADKRLETRLRKIK